MVNPMIFWSFTLITAGGLAAITLFIFLLTFLYKRIGVWWTMLICIIVVSPIVGLIVSQLFRFL